MGNELSRNVVLSIQKRFNTKPSIERAKKAIENGMSLFGTDMNRSTHYNTIEELEAARNKIHDQVFHDAGRSIYGCLACIPGASDNSKMVVVTKLLSNPWGDDTDILTINEERNIIDCIVSTLPPNRMINLFLSFEGSKVNNKRTVKTVIPFILNSPNLEWWSVKYKNKLRLSLAHCWGRKLTSIISCILKKEGIVLKDVSILKDNIDRYLVNDNRDYVYECLSFILNARRNNKYTLKLFKQYYAAKTDFNKAVGLPKEIIEGIRATYHPNIDKATTLKIAEKSMTSKEKKLVQNQAKKSNVKIDWNPFAQSLVDLVIYGFKMRFSGEVTAAINFKANEAASTLPFKYDHVGIICDDSFSMSGSDEQKLRALAVAYSTVEMLKRTGLKSHSITTTSGRAFNLANLPADGTDLASSLIRMLIMNPDAIFVVSDGYENMPEGRFNEVLKIAKDKLRINIPVYHFNPVSSAESKVALKSLSDDIPLTPVNDPEKMGLTLFKTMLSVDPIGGIAELFNIVLPQIENSKNLYARKAISLDKNKMEEIAK